MRLVGFAFLILVVLVLGVLWVASSPVDVSLANAVAVIGAETPVEVRVVSPHGVRHVKAEIEQDGVRHAVYESAQPATRLWFWRKKEAPASVRMTVGTKSTPQVKDGKARLIVQATANDFRAHTATLAQDVHVNSRPPSITADGAQHYINQGGSELVTFTVAGYVTESGVRTGKYTFRSFPLPGRSGARFSLFAYPWDLPPDLKPVAYARNPSGSEARAPFWFRLFPKKFRSRELDLTDDFLERIVNQIDPSTPGDVLQRFLKINGEMRRANNQTLADLRLKTEERFLWSGPFLQLGNSKVEAQFADARTYMYKGKQVDQQMHLGFDLSVVKNTPVPASNAGRVIFAEKLGIYGNCIVIDHGYGLQSIYGHLSEFAVKPGDMVSRSQVIGKSGATGLAGGDHVHYSMQVDGVQVNPIEWWDAHWIQDRILSKVHPAMASAASPDSR